MKMRKKVWIYTPNRGIWTDTVDTEGSYANTLVCECGPTQYVARLMPDHTVEPIVDHRYGIDTRDGVWFDDESSAKTYLALHPMKGPKFALTPPFSVHDSTVVDADRNIEVRVEATFQFGSYDKMRDLGRKYAERICKLMNDNAEMFTQEVRDGE